jgi:hypothetical protein
MDRWVWPVAAAGAVAAIACAAADEPSTREVEAERKRREDAEFEVRPLEETVRQRYLLVWQDLQARFVDDPHDVVRRSVDLIHRAMRDRGYPTVDFELRLGLTPDTEELRRAFVHYRTLFWELLEQDRATAR